MSKFLWVFKKRENPKDLSRKIEKICNDLVPEKIIPEKTKIIENENSVVGIVNPKNNVYEKGKSFYIGNLLGKYTDWNIPGTQKPDGSFSLVRENEDYIEIVSDPSGSKSIWHFSNDDFLIASNSQLAIVKFLGDFKLNLESVAWMISSGTLGPGNSWDKRIKLLPPDSSLIFNKKNGTLVINIQEIIFKSSKTNEKEELRNIENTLEFIFNNLNINFKKWILPLSGGYDSRAILFFLKKFDNQIRTITWGTNKSLSDPKSDATIAKKLAKKENTEHSYFTTDLTIDSLDNLIKKFIKNGEGRIDSIYGYLDNFKIWEYLHNSDVEGIIRGDVGWTSDRNLANEYLTRKTVNLRLINDYKNLDLSIIPNLLNQKIPLSLQRKQNESNVDWRDRLYHSYRIPIILSALADLKLGYVEQSNPLLSRLLLDLIRKQPTEYRKNKKLFKKIVTKMYPDIEIAEESSLEPKNDFLDSKILKEYLHEVIINHQKKGVFSQEFISMILKNLRNDPSNKNPTSPKKKSSSIVRELKIFLKKYLLKDRFEIKENLNLNLAAFRVIIVLKSIDLFETSYID